MLIFLQLYDDSKANCKTIYKATILQVVYVKVIKMSLYSCKIYNFWQSLTVD